MNEITLLMNAESGNPPASGVDLEQVMDRGRRRRRRRAIAISAGASLTAMAVVATLLVAGNLLRGGPSSRPGPGATSATDPVALLGVWAVSSTNERGEVRLRLGAREFHAAMGCGELFGEWRVNAAGQFLAEVHGGEGQCDIGPPTGIGAMPGWLVRAVGFRFDGGDAELLDGQGFVLARLSPRPESDLPAVVPDDPAMVAAFRAASANPAPLPDGLTPATSQSLLGRWLPLDPGPTRPHQPFLRISADGGWEGSDGCNGTSGRWVGGLDGLVMATIGFTTDVFCDNDTSAATFASARRSGFDGDVLVLVGAAGTEMARFRPAPR